MDPREPPRPCREAEDELIVDAWLRVHSAERTRRWYRDDVAPTEADVDATARSRLELVLPAAVG
jgi:hypothetical protein